MAVIGVNLLWLVPGVVGGSEEYTLRLLRALGLAGDEGLDEREHLELRLYGQDGLFDAHPDLASRFEAVVAPAAAGGSKLARVASEHTWLARVSRDDDLVHHAGGVIPAVRSRPSIVTIHDLQPLELPDYFSAAKRRWLATMIPRSVRAARLILCPSDFTAERLQVLLGVPARKLRVVRHGHEACRPGIVDHDADAKLRQRFGRFLLLPAITYRHKRHADLVAALDRLRDHFADLTVVITGRAGPQTGAVQDLARQLGLANRVHQLGRVSEVELDALYRSAVALVFPSEYEGFGNPVLEAMARGCPVVTTDAGALPEVAGSAALVVPIGHPVALAAAVARILEEPGLRHKLRAAGVDRARQFPWSESGRQLASCYRQALSTEQAAA
jgi:alpha-1,3-rhamnosyl/mannosyltransferase